MCRQMPLSSLTRFTHSHNSNNSEALSSLTRFTHSHNSNNSEALSSLTRTTLFPILFHSTHRYIVPVSAASPLPDELTEGLHGRGIDLREETLVAVITMSAEGVGRAHHKHAAEKRKRVGGESKLSRSDLKSSKVSHLSSPRVGDVYSPYDQDIVVGDDDDDDADGNGRVDDAPYSPSYLAGDDVYEAPLAPDAPVAPVAPGVFHTIRIPFAVMTIMLHAHRNRVLTALSPLTLTHTQTRTRTHSIGRRRGGRRRVISLARVHIVPDSSCSVRVRTRRSRCGCCIHTRASIRTDRSFGCGKQWGHTHERWQHCSSLCQRRPWVHRSALGDTQPAGSGVCPTASTSRGAQRRRAHSHAPVDAGQKRRAFADTPAAWRASSSPSPTTATPTTPTTPPTTTIYATPWTVGPGGWLPPSPTRWATSPTGKVPSEGTPTAPTRVPTA
jgi:hypothetical protein